MKRGTTVAVIVLLSVVVVVVAAAAIVAVVVIPYQSECVINPLPLHPSWFPLEESQTLPAVQLSTNHSTCYKFLYPESLGYFLARNSWFYPQITRRCAGSCMSGKTGRRRTSSSNKTRDISTLI